MEDDFQTEIARLVERQRGHITRSQLLGLGASATWVRSRIRVTWLVPIHAGVYAVGHVPRDPLARALAAVLACGEEAALSHAAAAALWGVAEWPRTLEVVAPRERRRPGIWTHTSATLAAGDRRRHHGIPVTSPIRTVLDLQSRLSDARATRLVNDLRVAGRIGPTALEQLCARSARLDGLIGDRALTRSALEDLFRRFVSRHRLSMPELNAVIPETGREVDALYRAARLIIELDSWRHHGDRASFERDRAKDGVALALGYRTLRVTARRLRDGGDDEARTIRRVLAS